MSPVRRILWLCGCLIAGSLMAYAQMPTKPLSMAETDYIVDQIIRELAENEDINSDVVHDMLYDLVANPIDLNTATTADLQQLLFLSDQQIDDILYYVMQHPLDDVYELRLVHSLHDYDVLHMLPFVCVRPREEKKPLYAAQVLRGARHTILARLDARRMEDYEGTDPMYAQLRYQFNYANRIRLNLQIKRPAGAPAREMQYGASVQLRQIDRRGIVDNLVAGQYQASFGHGLVFANSFHAGKSAYVLSAGNSPQCLSTYSGTDNQGLHGVGMTLHFDQRKTQIYTTLLYSMQHANDSTWHHTLGANLTIQHDRLRVGVSLLENLYTDSIHPYRNAAYNAHYFRGRQQAVVGVNARYNFGVADVFAEVAASQNQQWGYGALLGTRVSPVSDVGLIAMARYYSLWFDNERGYALSQTTRLGDERGIYLGADIGRVPHLRLNMYADFFYFSGVKYGIPTPGTWGYDLLGQGIYTPQPDWQLTLRLRARYKGQEHLLSGRWSHEWQNERWRVRTQLDANFSPGQGAAMPYGVSIAQEAEYRFAAVPLVLQARAQVFDVRTWDNRIYLYENDVLHAFSIPSTYGVGGRWYVNLRWRIIQPLSLYLRLSETVYTRSWMEHQKLSNPTRTDIHLLLKATI